MVCLGGLTQGSHLFPFRTEKLSTVEPMILLVGKVGSRQDIVFDLQRFESHMKMWFFVLLYSHMTWATRRRFIIVLILVVVFGGLAFWHFSSSLFVAPTCSDHKQDGDEVGVDCGGTMCTVMCASQVSVPTVLTERARELMTALDDELRAASVGRRSANSG